MTIPGWKNLVEIFEAAERLHPDLMEPYSSRLDGVLDATEAEAIMRAGLADTFRQRFPMPDYCWPKPLPAGEAEAVT
jgi:hypothetical protein